MDKLLLLIYFTWQNKQNAKVVSYRDVIVKDICSQFWTHSS